MDGRLAIPEAGEEYIDGVCYEVMAGEQEHADPQCQLSYVVRACVASGGCFEGLPQNTALHRSPICPEPRRLRTAV